LSPKQDRRFLWLRPSASHALTVLKSGCTLRRNWSRCIRGCKLAGYYVLKIDGQASWLMEFVTPVSPRRLASALLLHLIETAQAAGCTHLTFSAPPRWRHWKLLHAVGFLPVPSEIYVLPTGKEPELRQLAMWQWVPGEMDDL
jgi:hypothetical protein